MFVSKGWEENTMLKDREKQILDYMKLQIQTKGYPPTVREICAALGIKSTSTVHKDIENLVRDGYLMKDPSKPRALMIVDPEHKGEKSKKVYGFTGEYSGSASGVSEVIDVPVVGRVAAGRPILAEENIDDMFPVPARFTTGSAINYMLKVKGESMIEAGIMDGDLILVQQTTDVHNGEIVVAMIDGFESEATVKTFYKEADHIRLQPENHTMSPILVKDVTILGKVKGVFRYFS
jgi:repressor LexA